MRGNGFGGFVFYYGVTVEKSGDGIITKVKEGNKM